MIIEFFGLSNTGKSLLKKELERKRHHTLKYENISLKLKFFNFLKYIFKHPLNVTYLFFKLNTSHLVNIQLSPKKTLKTLRMRNSYLVSVLSKSEFVKKTKQRIFVDEFSLQSLFMIVNHKSNKQEISKIIRKLPKPDAIVLFENKKELRHEAYKKPHPLKKGANHFPGSWISHSYAKEWMKTMEHNFEETKSIILEDYSQNKEILKDINIYKRKVYVLKTS
tara:strand:+ start:361 stop:1026 length:666 start_codon:yes stop_codon:yes gene_type:complete